MICDVDSFSIFDVEKFLQAMSIRKYGIKFQPIYNDVLNRFSHSSFKLYFNEESKEEITIFRDKLYSLGWKMLKENINDTLSYICNPMFNITMDKDELPNELYCIMNKKVYSSIRYLIPIDRTNPLYLFLDKPNNINDEQCLLSIETVELIKYTPILTNMFADDESKCFIENEIPLFLFKVC